MAATNKRKRDALTGDDETGPLHQSLSQMSISRQKVVKQPKLDGERLVNDKHRPHTPSYLKMPDHIFVRMLSKTIEQGERIIQWLDTKEKIDFIRQIAQVTNNVHYFDLQRQHWQDHYDLGLREGWWGMELARSYAKQHRVCRAYSFKKPVIEEQQRMARDGLQQNVEALQKYLLQLEVNARQWQPIMDPHLMSCTIDKFVQHGQKRLRDEFDYKKKMLIIDATDHYLIRSFYWFQPTEEQVSSNQFFSEYDAQMFVRCRSSWRKRSGKQRAMLFKRSIKKNFFESESLFDDCLIGWIRVSIERWIQSKHNLLIR